MSVDKGREMAKTSATGGFQLFLGRSISTVILAVGTIILGVFISDTDLYLYTIALIPATTFLLFQDWGVATALTRYCAKYRALNDELQLRRIIIAGMIFEVGTGIVLTIISVLSANFVATTINGNSASGILIVLASVTILMSAIATAPGGIFTGFEQMKYMTYVSIALALVQGILAPLLVFLGYGAMGAVLAFTLSSVVGGLISVFLLYFKVMRKLPKAPFNRSEIYDALKPLLKFGIPLATGNILAGLLSQFYGFMMAHYVVGTMIANNKIASNFTILLSLLSYPLMTVLFPAFSKLDHIKEKDLLKTVYASSVKYTVLIVVPATLAMVVLSQPLIGTLYGNKWPFAPFLLSLSVLYNLLSLFGWRSYPSLLQAMDETRLILYLNLLSLIISIPLAFYLVPAFGIVGIVVGIPGSAIPSTFIGLYLTWKRYGVKANLWSSAKILVASALSTAATYAFLVYVTAPYVVLLAVGAAIFLFVYLFSAPIVGAINMADVYSLRSMFSSSSISRILEIPLKLIEKILKLIKREK